jgi:RNA polymerase sigma factor (TIGR02999 family)
LAAATIVFIVVFPGMAMNDVTQILSRIEAGDPTAAEQLLPLVYDELRKLAAAKLALEKPGQTLEATALVHEAYVRLAGENRQEPWRSRRQFFAAAAEAMRRILVDNARRKKSHKHGGDLNRQDFDLMQIESRRAPEEILALHEALDALNENDPTKAELVKLRYFVGLSIREAAEIMGVSASSVDRQWAYARAWLHQQIAKGDTSAP